MTVDNRAWFTTYGPLLHWRSNATYGTHETSSAGNRMVSSFDIAPMKKQTKEQHAVHLMKLQKRRW